jgi:glucokinase
MTKIYQLKSFYLPVGNVAPGEVLFAKKYHNEDHSSFSEVCHLFLKEAKMKDKIPVACVLACAGPILNNTVTYVECNRSGICFVNSFCSLRFTNIKFGWSIDGAHLESDLGINTVRLINDFAAMGYGLLTLKPHEYIALNDVPRERGAPIATIGAGTGLGECFLTADTTGKYSCFACEGGHTDFAPADELEIEIYNHLKKSVS